MPMTQIMREFPRPRIEVEDTDFGFRLVTLRQISDKSTHVRVTNLVFPNAFIIPMSREMTITQWHVPIDDEKHYWYAIFTSFGEPVNKDEMRRQRLELYQLPDYVPQPATRATITASIRTSRNTRPIPAWAPTSTCMTSGPASRWARSRTAPQEHLGTSDKAIIAYRRLLRQAIEQAGKGEQADHGARRAQAAPHHRPCGHRRHRPDRRLAGLLAEHRSDQTPGGELDESAVSRREGHI